MNYTLLTIEGYPEELVLAWEKFGFTVMKLSIKQKEIFQQQLKHFSQKYKSIYFFTIDFKLDIAIICHQNGIRYISWEADCPNVAFWNKAALYDSNYIFSFDCRQYEQLLLRGMKHVWHLPLATCVDTFQRTIQICTGEQKERYTTDVSFVGTLYNDSAHNLYDQIHTLPQYLQGYIDAIIASQKRVWGVDLITCALNENIIDYLKRYIKLSIGDDYDKDVYEVAFFSIIGKKIAQLERKEAVSYLTRHYQFSLYTRGDTSFDEKVVNRGYADYLTEMPLIFHYSKININITIRTITSGISLRVLDVLACEGFLLTNYQPEIAEYFIDGEELVIYQDFEDMYRKIDYYLIHEEERKRIAHAGFLKVKEYFNYDKGISSIIKALEI